MSAIDDAIAANRGAVVAALWDMPAIREKLSYAEISQAVDNAFARAGVPALVAAAVAADAVVQAVAANITTPPPAVAAAVSSYAPKRTDVGSTWEPAYEP